MKWIISYWVVAVIATLALWTLVVCALIKYLNS